jgi:hypothetical protein
VDFVQYARKSQITGYYKHRKEYFQIYVKKKNFKKAKAHDDDGYNAHHFAYVHVFPLLCVVRHRQAAESGKIYILDSDTACHNSRTDNRLG